MVAKIQSPHSPAFLEPMMMKSGSLCSNLVASIAGGATATGGSASTDGASAYSWAVLNR